MSDSGYGVVTTTVASAEEARALGRALLTARLAACVQIVPIESVYRWQGQIEEASECALHCKIAVADFAGVRDAIIARHSYDLPEIVLLPIAAGSDAYLDWLGTQTQRE